MTFITRQIYIYIYNESKWRGTICQSQTENIQKLLFISESELLRSYLLDDFKVTNALFVILSICKIQPSAKLTVEIRPLSWAFLLNSIQIMSM